MAGTQLKPSPCHYVTSSSSVHLYWVYPAVKHMCIQTEMGLTDRQLYHLPTVPLLNPDLASKGHIILGRSHCSLLSMGSCSLSILLLWRPTPGREDSSPKAKF